MKTRYKIPIIVGIVILICFVVVIGPVFLMIGSNTLAGSIISHTSDEKFEEDFAKIPEVNLFIEKYPNYSTSHSGDFLGWKIINYGTDTGKNTLHLSVKKSVLHQGVKVSAGCSVGGTHSYALNVLGDDVINYLKNDVCLKQ